MIYFYLLAINEEAVQIASDPLNKPFAVFSAKGYPGLRIGDWHEPKIPGNLITFGKDLNTCDVHLGKSKYISKTHCYIYVEPSSGEFILRDVSGSKSTFLEVVGEEEKYSLQGDPRRRVLPRGKASAIAFVKAIFETVWLRFDIYPEKTFLSPESSFIRTTVERISLPPPSYNTRIQRPKARFGVQILERIDHEPRKGLGEGTFGAVKLTVDLDSGRLLAVKQLKVDHEREKKEKEKAKSEVQIISTLEHSHIAVFIHSQGWEKGQKLELFMIPYDGTLRAVKGFGSSVDPLIQRTLMIQMLSALAYLQQRKLVHSDIKPDNILQNGMGKKFYLADFGLSSYLDNARCGRGTDVYAPPEAFGNSMVDTAADIWSLGITLLEMEHASEMGCCVTKAGKDVRKYHRGIISIAQSRRHDLLPMLKENPVERFDAEKCVQHYFSYENTSPQRSTTLSKDKKMTAFNSKVNANSGDPMSLDSL